MFKSILPVLSVATKKVLSAPHSALNAISMLPDATLRWMSAPTDYELKKKAALEENAQLEASTASAQSGPKKPARL